MGNKILYLLKYDADGDNLWRIEMDENRRIIEREKVNGRYKEDRIITPTEAGYAIAAKRFRDKQDYEWKLPGELVGALTSVITEVPTPYWAVKLSQAIQKMKDPLYEVVDYAAIRARDEAVLADKYAQPLPEAMAAE